MQDNRILTTVPAGDTRHNDYGWNYTHNAPSTTSKPRRLGWLIGGAVALTGASIAFFLLRSDMFQEPAPVMQKLTTETAQRKMIRLPDGTQISLNPLSSLSYPESFSDTNREVVLEGEAYFEVADDPNRPFTVRSGKLKTVFPAGSGNSSAMVQAYSNQLYLASTLLNGNANVSTDSVEEGEPAPQPIALKQNQAAIYIPESNEFFSQDFPTADRYLKPRIRGQYRFWGQSPREVLKEVQRTYPDEVELKGNFEHCRFYGVFQAQEPLEKFLNSFATSINAKLSRNGETWVLTGKGCKSND